MQRLEVSGVVRPIYGSLGVKRLNNHRVFFYGLTVGLCSYMISPIFKSKCALCFLSPSEGCCKDYKAKEHHNNALSAAQWHSVRH